jgi:hypothetical protein
MPKISAGGKSRLTIPAGVFCILSGGADLSVSSGQHSSSCPIDTTPISSESQDDRFAWSAQIARQLGDKPNTLSASANASHRFIDSGRYFIGGDYTEFCSGRQTRRSFCKSIINNAGIPVGLISFNAFATANQIGV